MFYDTFCKNNSPEIMNGAYVTNHINADKVTCSHSFGVNIMQK